MIKWKDGEVYCLKYSDIKLIPSSKRPLNVLSSKKQNEFQIQIIVIRKLMPLKNLI